MRKELRDWLRRLHDEVHVTSVFVTHDQEEALEVADTIVVVNEGVIEQVGTPEEIYDHPASDFVFHFIGEATQLGESMLRPHDVLIRPREQSPGAEGPQGGFAGEIIGGTGWASRSGWRCGWRGLSRRLPSTSSSPAPRPRAWGSGRGTG